MKKIKFYPAVLFLLLTLVLGCEDPGKNLPIAISDLKKASDLKEIELKAQKVYNDPLFKDLEPIAFNVIKSRLKKDSIELKKGDDLAHRANGITLQNKDADNFLKNYGYKDPLEFLELIQGINSLFEKYDVDRKSEGEAIAIEDELNRLILTNRDVDISEITESRSATASNSKSARTSQPPECWKCVFDYFGCRGEVTLGNYSSIVIERMPTTNVNSSTTYYWITNLQGTYQMTYTVFTEYTTYKTTVSLTTAPNYWAGTGSYCDQWYQSCLASCGM